MSSINTSDRSKTFTNPLTETPRRIRVLVAEDEAPLGPRIVDFLNNSGFDTRYVNSGSNLMSLLQTWRPDFIIIDQLLPEVNALQLLIQLRQLKGSDGSNKNPHLQLVHSAASASALPSSNSSTSSSDIRVIVLSNHSHAANVRECMRWGAIDYLVKPFKYIDLLTRLVLHSQAAASASKHPSTAALSTTTSPSGAPVAAAEAAGISASSSTSSAAPGFAPSTPSSPPSVSSSEVSATTSTNLSAANSATSHNDDGSHFLHLVSLLAREATMNFQVEEHLTRLSRMVAMSLKAVRVSIVKCDAIERKGEVWASSDHARIGRLDLNLQKYPEMLYVLHTRRFLALDNLLQDQTMHEIAKKNKSISFNSIMVAPIILPLTEEEREKIKRQQGSAEDPIWGVISARMPDSKGDLAENEIRFMQIFSSVVALVLEKKI